MTSMEIAVWAVALTNVVGSVCWIIQVCRVHRTKHEHYHFDLVRKEVVESGKAPHPEENQL